MPEEFLRAVCVMERNNTMSLCINNVEIKKFEIVRKHFNMSFLTYDVALTLAKRCNLRMIEDTVNKPREYEIIVGDCEREGVKKICDYDTFEVRIEGKKVYLNGGSSPAVTIAVWEFRRLLREKENVTDDMSFVGSYTEFAKNYDDETYYKPVFFDDFDDIEGDHVSPNGIDTTKWNLRGGDGHSSWSHEGHNGARCDRSLDPKRVYVKDSCFQIHPWYDEENNVFYGGFLESNGKMKFTYGYIEISAKIPDGDGFWSCLWLRCNDRSGRVRPEIDVNECFGNGACVTANLHTWPGEDAEQYGITHTPLKREDYFEYRHWCPDDKCYGEDFHTFGVLWTDEIAWFTCDGVPYFKYKMGDKETDAECFSKKVWIVLSEAVGFKNVKNPLNNTPEEWKTKGSYYVDWCYLYQIKDGKQIIEFMEQNQ